MVVDVADTILPPPGTMPQTLELLAVASEVAGIIGASIAKVDEVLGGSSTLTFAAEAAAAIYELAGPAFRDLAAGKSKSVVYADLDSALADVIERVRFPVVSPPVTPPPFPSP